MKKSTLGIILLMLSLHAGGSTLQCISTDEKTDVLASQTVTTDECGITRNYGPFASKDMGCKKTVTKSALVAGLRVTGPSGAGTVWTVASAPDSMTAKIIRSSSSNIDRTMQYQSCVVESDTSMYCIYNGGIVDLAHSKHIIVTTSPIKVSIKHRANTGSRFVVSGGVSVLNSHKLDPSLMKEFAGTTVTSTTSMWGMDMNDTVSVETDVGTTIQKQLDGVGGLQSGQYPPVGSVTFKIRSSTDVGPVMTFSNGRDEIETNKDLPTLVILSKDVVGTYKRYIDATVSCP